MSKKEKQKVKVKMFNDKKWMFITGGLLVVLIIFTLFISTNYPELPEGYSEELVIEESKRAIEYFNERDYQSIVDMGGGNLVVTAEQFAEQCDGPLDACGEFVGYKDIQTMGAKDNKSGNEYGGAVIKAEYENFDVKFIIAFDLDMNLVEFLPQ